MSKNFKKSKNIFLGPSAERINLIFYIAFLRLIAKMQYKYKKFYLAAAGLI